MKVKLSFLLRTLHVTLALFVIYAACPLYAQDLGTNSAGTANNKPRANARSNPSTPKRRPRTPTNKKRPDAETGRGSNENASPSWRLVGSWQASVSEFGQQMEVSLNIKADGTCTYYIRAADGRTANQNGLWQYSNGIFYETFPSGAIGKGSITWINNDAFIVTIIDNGVPAYSGLKRRYRRLNVR